MAYAIESDVRAIIAPQGSDSLAAFMAASDSMVGRHLAPLNAHTPEELAMIAAWLAAHFYTIFRNRVSSEHAGPVGQSFQYKTDLYLAASMYGQQAIALDHTGTLARLNKDAADGTKRRPGALWLGTDRYGDRG